MENLEAIQNRHSVRSFTDAKIEKTKINQLEKLIAKINEEADLNFKLVVNEPKAFSGMMSSRFENVNNYVVLAGKKSKKLDELVGYYGEMVVIEAQKLGLNTCWVALTFSKGTARKYLDEGTKLVCVLSIGYGTTGGTSRKSKTFNEVVDFDTQNGEVPEWFKSGIECALLAPTAINQQRFMFSLKDNEVSVDATGGFYANVDLGIVKYHFEIGAGKENFVWAK